MSDLNDNLSDVEDYAPTRHADRRPQCVIDFGRALDNLDYVRCNYNRHNFIEACKAVLAYEPDDAWRLSGAPYVASDPDGCIEDQFALTFDGDPSVLAVARAVLETEGLLD